MVRGERCGNAASCGVIVCRQELGETWIVAAAEQSAGHPGYGTSAGLPRLDQWVRDFL